MLVTRDLALYPSSVNRVVLPSRSRRYWRATLRSAPLVELILLDRWHHEVRVFRWRLLAQAAVLRYRRSARGRVTQCLIEPYDPGANVVTLRSGRQG